MDDCIEYMDMISAYVDGELSESGKQQLEAHIKTCANCCSILIAYRGISAAVDESGVPAPEALARGVMDRINDENAVSTSANIKKFKLVNRILTRYIPVAACLVLLLLTVPRLFRSGNRSNSDTASAPRSQSSPSMASSAPQPPAGSQGGAVNSSANESSGAFSSGSSSAPEAPAPAAAPENAQSESERGELGDSADSGRVEEPMPSMSPSVASSMAPAPSMEMAVEEADSYPMESPDADTNPTELPNADSYPMEAPAPYRDDVYAIIMITGELPALLEKYEPEDSSDSGELYYKIPLAAAKALIKEIADRDGAVVDIANENGSYAIVYYTP